MSSSRAIAHRWTILLGAWLAVAGFACSAIWLSRHMLALATPVGPLLLLEVPVWMYWVAATVLIIRLSDARPLDNTRPWASLVIHASAATLVAAGWVGFRLLWYQAFNPFPYLDPHVAAWFWRMFREQFVYGFTLYWAVVGVCHAFANYSRVRQRDVAARVMRGELAEARLETLRLQLQPHFLFNALNTVSAVLEENPRRARRIIGRLGELLRASLRTNTSAFVPLGEEVALVAAYLEIEAERFGGRLGHSLEIPPDTAAILVPSFMLQPLVENAVRHGIGPREGPGHVSLRVSLDGDLLEIHVEDDGVGLAKVAVRDGIGLGNTRRRLEAMYSGNASISLLTRAGGGLDVRIRIPRHRQPVVLEGVA